VRPVDATGQRVATRTAPPVPARVPCGRRPGRLPRVRRMQGECRLV